jgi:molecular chaperone DnaK
MTKDAEAHAEDDKKAKEKIELRNNADSTAYGAEKMLKDLGDKVDAAKKTEIEDEIKKVKDALEKDDADAIKAAVESLNAKVQAVSADLYKQAAAQAPTGGAPEGAPEAQTPPTEGAAGASPKDADVVDADFEMVDKDEKKGKK